MHHSWKCSRPDLDRAQSNLVSWKLSLPMPGRLEKNPIFKVLSNTNDSEIDQSISRMLLIQSRGFTDLRCVVAQRTTAEAGKKYYS